MGREAPEGGDLSRHMADSRCCTADPNSIVEQLYPDTNVSLNFKKGKKSTIRQRDSKVI